MGAPLAGHPVPCDKVGHPPPPSRPALRANHRMRDTKISPVCLDLGPRASRREREGGETALPTNEEIG